MIKGLVRKELQALKGSLDSIFSRYIRLRDSDEEGYGRCITCDNKVYWSQASCGHFYSRNHNSTRYNEQNCNLQCKECNNKEGASQRSPLKKVYADRLQAKFGPEVLMKLKRLANENSPLTESKLRSLRKHYQKQVEKLINKKRQGID